jgi:hypothetical protein
MSTARRSNSGYNVCIRLLKKKKKKRRKGNVNLWFESNNSLLIYTHICLFLLPQACTLGCYDCHIAILWCLYPMLCHQYQDGYAVVCLTTSSRLLISVMYAVHSTQSILYNCYVCSTLFIYYSCTTMIDQLHCITLILSILPLHLYSNERKERKSLVSIQT